MPGVVIFDVPQDNQFVATIEDATLPGDSPGAPGPANGSPVSKRAGYIDYSLTGRGMLIRHTEVDSAYEGQGVGGALSRFALDTARARGIEVIPICPFVAAWIMRHPEYSDLVIESMRGQFERK